MPMVFLVVGAVAFAVIDGLPDPDPIRYADATRHLTELCVIISLMGAGLALNRPVGLKRWATTWRLLTITMPLSMLAVGLLGWAVLGLGAAGAVLLAEHAEGFVALAATFLTYGLTELVEGYGFVAVFVCACTIRAAERSHGYHRVLHQYIEQTERMLTVLIIFLLGGIHGNRR